MTSALLPFFAQAALVPCATKDHPEPCTICHLVVGIKGIIDFGVAIIVIVSILIIIIGGIIYIVSSGDPGMMEKAKSAVTAAIIGFAVFVCAWLIINVTLAVLGANIGLVTGKSYLWYQFSCQ